MATLKPFYTLANRQALSPEAHLPIRRYYLTAMLLLLVVFVLGYLQLLQVRTRSELEHGEVLAILTTGIVCVVITLFIFRPMEQRMRQVQRSLLGEIETSRQIERVVSRSEELYRLLAHNLPQTAVILFDTNLRYMLAEGSILEAAGYSKEALEGKTLYESVPLETIAAIEPNYRAALAGQEIIFEGVSSNSALIYHAHMRPIRDDQKVIVGGMLLIQDITERKRIEAERREREQVAFSLAIEKERSQVLAQFIQDSSHDLRTPLTIISTNLYLLRKLTAASGQEARFDVVDKQVWQLNRIIDDLHTMSKLDMLTSIKRYPLDANQMVRDIQMQVGLKIVEKHQSLVFDLQDDLPPLPADEGRVKQALTHLLDNAYLYTPENGTITVKTVAANGEIIISVQDDGVGITAEHHELIFKRFYKVDDARTAGQSGSGLGLAMVKRIMELHGGRIEVESDLGQGSIFRLCFPLSTPN